MSAAIEATRLNERCAARACLLANMQPLIFPWLLSVKTAFNSLIPWWQGESATMPACEISRWLAPDASIDMDRLKGSLTNATIISFENPLWPLLSGAAGNFALQIIPTMLFISVAVQAISVLLRPRLSGSPVAPSMIRLILTSNVAICGLCALLLCAGGGTHGNLLPSGLPRFKMFNYSLLAGSSAAVEILLASYIGNILEGHSADKPPSRIVLTLFFGMVFLDLAQGFGLMLIVNPLTTLYMPAMLIVGELASSSWLAQRSLSLQRKIRAVNDSSLQLSAVHRRLVISSVSAFAAMVFRCAI